MVESISLDELEAVEAAAEAEEKEVENDNRAKSPEEFKFGDDPDVPEQLRGKSAKEAFKLLNTYEQTTRQLASALQSRNVSSGEDPPKPKQNVKFEEKDIGYGADPDGFQNKMDQWFTEKIRPAADSFLRNSAAMAERLVENDGSMKHFALFKDQIRSVMQQLPLQQQADPRAWKMVYNNVVSENLDRVVEQEISQRERSRQSPPITETDVPGRMPGGGDEEIKITPELRSIASQMNVPVEDMVKMMKAGFRE